MTIYTLAPDRRGRLTMRRYCPPEEVDERLLNAEHEIWGLGWSDLRDLVNRRRNRRKSAVRLSTVAN
jgi:hypothetical protein